MQYKVLGAKLQVPSSKRDPETLLFNFSGRLGPIKTSGPIECFTSKMAVFQGSSCSCLWIFPPTRLSTRN